MKLFNYLKVLIVTTMLVLLGNQTSWAADASFSWRSNDPADGTVGYMLYCGTSSRQYTESVDIGYPVPINGRVYGSVSQLIPGQTYFFTVTAYNSQGNESPYPNEVVYTVADDTTGSSGTTDANLYDIYMAASSNLSGSVPLDGTSVDRDIYVFTGPDTGVSKVTFSVDGVVSRTETKAPYELVGGAPYDTSQLSPGEHQMTAMMYLNDGSIKFVSANFSIPSAYDNGDSSANDNTASSVDDQTDNSSYDILVTTSPNLLGAVSMDGSIVDGGIYVFTGPDTGVSRVTFSVDGVASRTETKAPFELVGGSPYDASQLAPGQHQLTAKMYLKNGTTESISADFTIPSSNDTAGNEDFHDILVSTSPNRSGATVLDGETVDGDIYIFTGPDNGVSQVIFSIDGTVTRTERKAPFDLVGGAAYDTSQLSPGEHEITAEIQLNDGGTEVVSAIFAVPSYSGASSAPSYTKSRCELLVSDTSYLSGATALDGATVDGDIYVFTGPDKGVSQVIFSIDGVVTRTERKLPFELVGGAAFNTSQLSRGTHQITASIQFEDGTSELNVALFTVK